MVGCGSKIKHKEKHMLTRYWAMCSTLLTTLDAIVHIGRTCMINWLLGRFTLIMYIMFFQLQKLWGKWLRKQFEFANHLALIVYFISYEKCCREAKNVCLRHACLSTWSHVVKNCDVLIVNSLLIEELNLPLLKIEYVKGRKALEGAGELPLNWWYWEHVEPYCVKNSKKSTVKIQRGMYIDSKWTCCHLKTCGCYLVCFTSCPISTDDLHNKICVR